MYLFDTPLQEGIILKRNSQFTMDVLLNDKIIKCHCPTTGRIGNVDVKNVSCLISHSENTKRKLPYTVEAISCDELTVKKKNWIGINQILSNKLVEYFLVTHQMGNMISQYKEIKREVSLGISKLDFLVDTTYIEVKTPLTTIHVKYGKNIRTKSITPFSSTDRFIKHIHELTGSLKEHERAILLTVYQYQITSPKSHQKSTNYEEVSYVMDKAIQKGVETWCIELSFTPYGVSLVKCENTTPLFREKLNTLLH